MFVHIHITPSRCAKRNYNINVLKTKLRCNK